jgi:uncharacterized protein (DUF2252 family)
MQWATPQERTKQGQDQRKRVGRQQHDALDIKARARTPFQLLQRSMRGRVPALVKLKYELMADSPFGYFRGAVPVMAADLAALPDTGIVSQLCGDAHVRNVGAYAAPDGRLVFDINDFDETIRGPFEWDLKRMAASISLAGRGSGQKDAAVRRAVEEFVLRYTAQMKAFAHMPHLEVGHFLVHRFSKVEPVHSALLKAERATPLHTLEQLTAPVSGKPVNGKVQPLPQTPKGHNKSKSKSKAEADAASARRFKEIRPMLTPVTHALADAVIASLEPYSAMLEPQRQHLLSFYRPIDVCFKVVGTGSVGLRDYCVYFEGNGPDDPLFLQIKEEPASGYNAYLPNAHPDKHNGKRVADGQRAMQLQSDPFLGWTNIGSRQFLVRQLNDHKGSIDLEDLAGGGLAAFAEVCGELLARGHARSSDPMVIAGYLGGGDGFAEALGRFGLAYADQTEKDWEDLRKARKAGHVE